MRPQRFQVRPDGATRAFPIPRDPLATLAILLITSILKKGAGSDNLARSSELVQHVLECGAERCGCSGCGAAKRALAQCVGCGCEVGVAGTCLRDRAAFRAAALYVPVAPYTAGLSQIISSSPA